MAWFGRGERFDFDEDHQRTFAVGRDQIDFASEIGFALRDNRVAGLAKHPGCGLLASSAEAGFPIDMTETPIDVRPPKAIKRTFPNGSYTPHETYKTYLKLTTSIRRGDVL